MLNYPCLRENPCGAALVMAEMDIFALPLRCHRPLGRISVPGDPVASQFQFRYVSRGGKSDQLAALAMRSLVRCHPNINIVMIDANDEPNAWLPPADHSGKFHVIHLPPGEDEVASALGRGTPKHMYYWRHSAEVMAALPSADFFTVYVDADIMFLRPMDLASLVAPLRHGRIAAAVDESSVNYVGMIRRAADYTSRLLPAAGVGGPLLQAGMIFTNPADDGGIFAQFWQLALGFARAGHIGKLPFDDMCLLAALLGQGGPLWERLLPLGHEWNYITNETQDPGIFGCAAHYGGHRAKAFFLARQHDFLPQGRKDCWGSIADPRPSDLQPDVGEFRLWRNWSGGPAQSEPVTMPFALSWNVPYGAKGFEFRAQIPAAESATFLFYVDGRLVDRTWTAGGPVRTVINSHQADVVTIIAATGPGGQSAFLDCSFHFSQPMESRD
jgi:hypothetical protein